jgi:hypothetical protein
MGVAWSRQVVMTRRCQEVEDPCSNARPLTQKIYIRVSSNVFEYKYKVGENDFIPNYLGAASWA